VDFLNLSGHFATRINNTGTWVREKAHKDGGYFRPSTQSKGIADITADITKNGEPISVWIEVKIGKDRMSRDQVNFKSRVKNYWVVKSFDDFFEKYNEFMKN
jgi:hypothetical protein